MGPRGAVGPTGATGATGPPGPTGATGPPGGLASFADFHARMPPDNALGVAAGGDVEFPHDGPSRGAGIVRADAASFTLREPGTYEVLFQVSVTDSGQLVLTLNGVELPETVVGRATGTSQMMGISLVQTTKPDSVLTVRNPAANANTLTLTPHAGGAEPVSAHIVIARLD